METIAGQVGPETGTFTEIRTIPTRGKEEERCRQVLKFRLPLHFSRYSV